MAVSSHIRRALLYVPSSSSRFLEKSRALNVDCIAYDLEDSVTPDRKREARIALRDFLDRPRPIGIREQAVRINAVDSGLALADLTEVLQASHVDTVVVPKVNSASDLHFVTDVIRHARRNTTSSDEQRPAPKILALIESAKALMNLSEICRASPYLSGLIFAAEDFALDLSITRTPSLDEFLYARSAIATACRANELPSTIDLVCTQYKGEKGLSSLEKECVQGKGMGFNGKQLIHPSQIETCQRAFSPSEDEVQWATRVLVADEKAVIQGRGAWTLEGRMIDAPVVNKARKMVKYADLCGYDVGRLRHVWADQEPE